MAREITTTGSKKVSTLMKEFNEHFPYLRLRLYNPEVKKAISDGVKSLTEFRVDIEKTLSEVRTKKGTGTASFTGSKNVGTVEKEFENIFGLFAQICFTTADGGTFASTGADDKKSLTELNREKAAAGCLKDQWK